MNQTDRDALIAEVQAEIDGTIPKQDWLLFPVAQIEALISLASPSPAWPEDVVERACNEFGKAYGPLTATLHDAMRAALAALPPPEDERVKGLDSKGEEILKNIIAEQIREIAALRSALASYRGGA